MIYNHSNLPNSKTYFYRAILFCLLIEVAIFLLLLYQTDLKIALKVTLGAFIWSLIFYIIPLIIIHINYHEINNNAFLRINEEQFAFSKDDYFIEFNHEEIKKVDLILSYPLYEKRFRWFFWDEYFYAIIHLKNGESLTVTCLIFDQLEELLPQNLIIRKKRIFPLIGPTKQ